MAAIFEQVHPCESLISEANGERSRELVTMLMGTAVKACAVLGKITASGKYVAINFGAADGSQNAAAIAYGHTDTVGFDAKGVIYARDCEHNANIVVWPSGATSPQKATATAALAALGIILR